MGSSALLWVYAALEPPDIRTPKEADSWACAERSEKKAATIATAVPRFMHVSARRTSINHNNWCQIDGVVWYTLRISDGDKARLNRRTSSIEPVNPREQLPK